MSDQVSDNRSDDKNPRVLIVDDMQVNCTILASMLSSYGISSDIALSGAECLEFCRASSYDLILLDHRMPDMDGVDTLVHLKEIFKETGVETPVICHTADEGQNYINLYKAAGFSDVLIKPVDPGQLLTLLKTYIPDLDTELPEDEDKKEQAEKELSSLPGWLKTVPKLDLVSGVEHCNSASDYLDALTVFTNSIHDKADDIERLEKEEDWPMYTLRMHSLKSVARLIGAVSIADMAADLEYAGRQGEYEKAHAGTAALLEEYRSMLPRLEKLLEKNSSAISFPEPGIEHDDDEPPVIYKDPTLLFIGGDRGIVSKGIIKKLTEEGFKIVTVKDESEEILLHRSEANLFLYYPSGDTDQIKLISTMLTEMCRDDNKTLCLTGDPLDIEAALKIHDRNYITSVYPRPVDLDKLAADMLSYSDLQSEYKRIKTILLIDDDPDFLSIMSKWLSGKYRVKCSRSGTDALVHLRRKRPDLILLDYEMPYMDGYQVMEKIRSNSQNEGVPIIFLTGKNDRECVMKILERKPDGYLLKSMPKEALLDSLDRFFAGQISQSRANSQ